MLERKLKTVPGAAEDLLVIGALVFVPQKQRFHARSGERVLQFVRAVRRIDIHQSRAGTGAAHMHHDPFDTVGRPQPDAVTTADAERPEAACDAVSGIAQFRPGHPSRLMARRDGDVIRKSAGSAMEKVADGQFKERSIGSSGVAQFRSLRFNKHSEV